jgi:PhzF family phenazine biosynthesis protein
VEFAYVDVFAAGPFTGNPATVVLDADRVDDATMRAIAREFNQSETAFVLAPGRPDADWLLRAFTPAGAEVFGAGHFALGAAALLADSGRLPGDRTAFVQRIGDSLYPTTVTRSLGGPATVSIRQSPPETRGRARDRAALAAALRVGPGELAPDGIAEVVSTGAGHLLVQLRDRAVVERVRPDPEPLVAVLDDAGGEGCAVFSLDPAEPGAHAHVRFFNPRMGIGEDPATSTAAGPLAAVLARRGLVPPGQPVIVVQGHAVGRPSRLVVHVDGDEVRLSGAGLVVATGTLRLPL